MAGDKIILDPEYFMKCAQAFELAVKIRVQSEQPTKVRRSGHRAILSEHAHEGVHLHKWNINFRVPGFGRVHFAHGIEQDRDLAVK